MIPNTLHYSPIALPLPPLPPTSPPPKFIQREEAFIYFQEGEED